jgi:hypothetical protein
MTTPSGIPVTYQGRWFPTRKALAKHLAPLLGKSVGAVEMALGRYDVEHAIDRMQKGVRSAAGNARPLSYQGQHFPSRAALAEYLVPSVGRTKSTLVSMLSRYDGDVERVLAAHPRGPISFEGKVFRSRRALADYLAPHLHRPARAVEALLIYCGDDDEGVPVVKLVAPERA